MNLKPKSIGLLYSDGITSATSGNGDNYTIGRIKDIVRLNKEDTPAVLIRKVYSDFKNFVQDTKLESDASLIILSIK